MKMFRHIINIAALAAVLVALHSCSARRQYGRTDVSPEVYFRDGNLDTTSIADIPWRVFFNDPTLVELIEEGLVFNRNLGMALSSIAQAEASLRATRAAFFPQVALAAQVNRTEFSNGARGCKVYGYHTSDYTLGAAVTWEADLWGKIASRNRAQYASYMASVEYANLVATSLISNIATTYYSLLALDEQLSITRRTVGLLDETTRTMQALMDAGLQTGAAVEQSRALYYSTLVTVPDLEASIRRTENSLSVLVGRLPGPVTRTTLELQRADTTLSHGLPMESVARRPDVARAEQQLRQAWELTRAARAAFYPSLTLGTGTSVGLASTTLSDFFKPENLIANIVGGLTAPVFTGRQIRSNYEASLAAREEALLNFEQTVLAAAQEVSDILYSLRLSLEKNPVRQRQITSLETSVYFTQELLKAGEANYTEVLTARQNLLQAELGRVTDRLEQLQYSVTLYRALGGGME